MLMANFIVAPFLLKSRNAVSVLFYNHVMLLGDCEGLSAYYFGMARYALWVWCRMLGGDR